MFLVNFGRERLPLKTATLVGATGSCLAEESSMTERNSVKVGGKSER
jgi:hypothetical protein